MATRDSPLGVHVTLDCRDPELLAQFWSAALGFEAGPVDQFTALVGDSFDLTLQRVDDLKAGKNRMHLDIRVDDLEEAIGRLVHHGASIVERSQVPGWTWAVMADPEGNEFCVMRPDWFFA